MTTSINGVGYKAWNDINVGRRCEASANDKTLKPDNQFQDDIRIEISDTGREKLKKANSSIVNVVDNTASLKDSYLDEIKKYARNYRVESNGTVRWSMSAEKGNELLSNYSKETRDGIDFWIGLTFDPTFLSQRYTPDEARRRLSEAGIKTGFFTVNAGERTATQFLSQGRNAVAVYSKEQYDNQYAYITSERFSGKHEAGQKFLIGGKEYTIGADHKLNIPYGEDVFDIEAVRE